MADERGIFQVVLLEESFYIFGKGYIVMGLIVWRVAVISCVNGIYGTGELARKDTGRILVTLYVCAQQP